MERLRSECIYCILRKQAKSIPEGTSESKKIEFLQRTFRVFAEAPKNVGAPVLVRDIDAIKKEMFGIEDEYGDIKKYFNQFMMSYEEMISEKIQNSEDPLKTAIQFSQIGNYIDFGAIVNVNEEELYRLLEHYDDYKIDEEEYKNLKEDLSKAKKLLLITDNCGEIVMDKLMLQAIEKLYPRININVLVRGMPVLNDATMQDAKQIGLDQLYHVCGNGNGIAGTRIEELSEEAGQLFDSADVMIAKGQGNFESLRYCGRNVYYLFLCKCDMFANQFQVPKLSGILVNDQNLLKKSK